LLSILIRHVLYEMNVCHSFDILQRVFKYSIDFIPFIYILKKFKFKI